jgi:hypothetical protein
MSKPAKPPLLSAQGAEAALAQWLEPMAQLALRSGLSYPETDELWRLAFIRAAGERNVSQLTAATGLHRKEVLRLQALLAADAAGVAREQPKRSWASQVLLRWADGVRSMPSVAVLPYASDEEHVPCFSKLSRSVTSDVHPRAVLEELLRLQLVSEERGKVKLLATQFVPGGAGTAKTDELMRVMAENVGEHLQAALHNVATARADERWLEQAIWGDGVSAATARELDAKARDLWAHAHRVLYQAMCDAPEAPSGETRHRVKIGMYASAVVSQPEQPLESD